MKKISALLLGGCAMGAMLLVDATPAEARCSKASATGVGLGRVMAMDMAKMNLDTSIAAQGKKARGRVHYACAMPLMTECKASRRAC